MTIFSNCPLMNAGRSRSGEDFKSAQQPTRQQPTRHTMSVKTCIVIILRVTLTDSANLTDAQLICFAVSDVTRLQRQTQSTNNRPSPDQHGM